MAGERDTRWGPGSSIWYDPPRESATCSTDPDALMASKPGYPYSAHGVRETLESSKSAPVCWERPWSVLSKLSRSWSTRHRVLVTGRIVVVVTMGVTELAFGSDACG